MYFPRWVIGLVALGSVLISCTKTETPDGKSATAHRHRVVNLAIWSNYLSSDLLDQFHQQTGIEVQIANYSSNEELLAKLQAGGTGYDVAVPSDYMVYVMGQLGLLRKLDLEKIPHRTFLDRKFFDKSFDPKNQYSLPYDWGTTGIAVNRSLYPHLIKGWKDLLTRSDLEGKFSLLDDAREVIGASLKMSGYSLNSKKPVELNAAKDFLLKAKRRIKAFTSEPLMPLINGEIAVAHAYVSDALQAKRATKGKIEYVIPEEGGTLWIDNLVIPSGAAHTEEAYELINFLLEGRSGASTTQSVFVASANHISFQLLPKEFQVDPSLFPPASKLKNYEMIEDLGDSSPTWDRAWTEIKAQRD